MNIKPIFKEIYIKKTSSKLKNNWTLLILSDLKEMDRYRTETWKKFLHRVWTCGILTTISNKYIYINNHSSAKQGKFLFIKPNLAFLIIISNKTLLTPWTRLKLNKSTRCIKYMAVDQISWTTLKDRKVKAKSDLKSFMIQ